MYVDHPLIKENSIFYRDYQVKIVEKLKSGENYLIVLPTGTGKTTIILLYVADLLLNKPEARILFIAPTKPLVKQHYEYFLENLQIERYKVTFFTGEMAPESRKLYWNRNIIFSTPQVVVNDILREYLDPRNIDVLVVDEAHHAVGNHPYVQLCSFFTNSTQIIGLTASPGDVEKTKEIMKNLRIVRCIILTRGDQELRKYLPSLNFKVVKTDVDNIFLHIISLVRDAIRVRINNFNKRIEEIFSNQSSGKSILSKLSLSDITFSKLIELREKILNAFTEGLIPSNVKKELLLIIYQLTLLDRLLKYIESYDWSPFIRYYEEIMQRVIYKRRRAEKEIVMDRYLYEAYVLAKKKEEIGDLYPKVKTLVEIVDRAEGKVIIFVSLRSVAKLIYEHLLNKGISARLLVGQQDREMTQQKQLSVLDDFKKKDIKVLVTTQVGEEGLDISECNTVIFYDNPVSAIRRIQRIGRTGRTIPGNVYFLVNPKTRDEGYLWAGLKKERIVINEMKKLSSLSEFDLSLESFLSHKDLVEKNVRDSKTGVMPTVIVDFRESSSPVVRELRSLGVNLQLKDLEIGDYIVGKFVIERKTFEDLASSLLDGRLFEQLKEVVSSGLNSILVLEGDERSFTRRLSKEVLDGTLISVVADFRIPILISDSPRSTARYIYRLAVREYKKGTKIVPLRHERKPSSISEIQKYIVAGLPDIDATLADRLLRRFKTVEKVFTAALDELASVKGIGPKIAEKIRKILTTEYKPEIND